MAGTKVKSPYMFLIVAEKVPANPVKFKFLTELPAADVMLKVSVPAVTLKFNEFASVAPATDP
jgi:hypothetical protein